MNGFISRTVFMTLMASVAITCAPVSWGQEVGADAIAARKRMELRDAMQQIQEARLAYVAKRYSKAVEHYRNALAVIPKAPATESQVKFIKDSLADALIAKAMDYRTVGRYDEAIEFLKEAVELSPDNKLARRQLAYTMDPERNNPAITPQHVANVEEVNRLLTLAHGYLDLGKYDEAYETFNSVLRIDPHNSAARLGQESVSRRRSQYYRNSRMATRAERLSAVDAQWEEQVPQETPESAGVTVPVEAEGGAVLSYDTEAEGRMADILKDMRVEQIRFEDASINDVIDALQGQVRRFEASGMNAGRPINITSNFGAVGTPGFETIMSRRVNLVLSNVSIADILDCLVKQVGITYYVTPIGVELSYSGKDFGPMVERNYTVAPHFFDMEKEESDDDDDDFDSGSSRMVVKRVNPVVALKSMGISFPEGSRARYDAGARRLTVVNTAHNHEEIASLISTPLGDTDKAVVLNVLAVEVKETDLNELGFEWLLNFNLNDSGSMYGGGGSQAVVSSATGVPVVQTGINTMGGGIRTGEMTAGLRSGMQGMSASNMDTLISTGSAVQFGSFNNANFKAPGVFAFRGVWGSGDLSVIMRGLSQKKGADVLYNPRLVFSPGVEEQVTFTNVREMFYPETYSEPQISTMNISMPSSDDDDNNSGNATVAAGSHPEDFTRFGMTEDSVGGVGTILQVHSAEVAPDGQHVTLALTVTINDFEGFINWGSPIESYQWIPGETTGLQKITLSPNYILKPVFKRRLENTKITVAPGSVLVMGGLQEGRVVRYEDKLPILGDLPLVGRLFRSQGKEEVRKAFILFTRVDIVDPTGKDHTGNYPRSTFGTN